MYILHFEFLDHQFVVWSVFLVVCSLYARVLLLLEIILSSDHIHLIDQSSIHYQIIRVVIRESYRSPPHLIFLIKGSSIPLTHPSYRSKGHQFPLLSPPVSDLGVLNSPYSGVFLWSSPYLILSSLTTKCSGLPLILSDNSWFVWSDLGCVLFLIIFFIVLLWFCFVLLVNITSLQSF